MTDGFEGWWRDLPKVTKWLFVGTLGTTLAGNFGLVTPYSLILDWNAVIREFQLWRLVTCFLYHSLGFPFLIHLMFLVQYGSKLERDTFQGRLSDYLYMLLISWVLLLFAGYLLSSYLLAMGLIMVLIYYWARKNPDGTMSLMFGIQFKAVYLPWVLVGMNVLMGGWPVIYVVGIVIGHIYFYFVDIYPRTAGVQVLKTPQFMYNIIPPEYNTAVRRVPQEQRQAWGRGQALGGQHNQ
eukprot:TRINITY_DN1080_c0_g1_i1.p1 TRINITY_DN1080_c0_g1~~TRINITY_DN1080_c0_g1_i1.p1  ORF type:complete len:238 (-),score=28.41 TRINITY_DN1080_c0_g1_i1:50-763(-)